MLITTTSSIEGYAISEYLGVVTGSGYDYVLESMSGLEKEIWPKSWDGLDLKVRERIRMTLETLKVGMRSHNSRPILLTLYSQPSLDISLRALDSINDTILSMLVWAEDTQSAIHEIQKAAHQLGANAILGVTLSFLSDKRETQGNIPIVWASGTAVIIQPVPSLKQHDTKLA